MRVVILSDHPSDMLADAARERERPAAEKRARVEAARRDRDRARAEGRWLAWLRLVFRVRREKRAAEGQHMFAQAPTDEEKAMRAGRDAERRVAAELGNSLDDEWVLLRGYANRRGEIDGLLLGPRGLFAYEVKYHNGTVYIRGDDWSSEKFDRYGNLVGARAPMRDGGSRGRSPSQQLSEPAAALTDWLRRNGQQIAVKRVVLLTHDRARVASSQNPTVQVLMSVRELLSLAGQAPVTLRAGQRGEIEQLIRRDHRHYEQRASRPPSRPASSPRNTSQRAR